MSELTPEPASDPWDAAASGWDQNPAVRIYADAAFRSLSHVLDDLGIELNGARALDFGCGTGLLTEQLVVAGAHVHAVDTSEAMLEVVRLKAADRGWDSVQISTAPPAAGQLDVVACSSVCGFVEDYPGTVLQLVDLLRPGGLFIQWDWERDPASEGDHGLDRTSIEAALTAAGLASIKVREAFAVTFEDQTMRPLMGFGIRSS